MKKILKLSWITVCVLVIAVCLLACLTPFIQPETFSFISLFAITFPYIFLAAFLCGLSMFFIHKKAALLLICLITAAGLKNLLNTVALHKATWGMEKQPGSLRLMTWNVESFVNGMKQSRPDAKPRVGILKAIQRYNPDILCFQEYQDIEHPTEPYISVKRELDSLGYIYSYVSSDSVLWQFHPAIIYEGSAIYSRIPLTDTGRINLTNVTRNENLIYADVMLHNRMVRVFTTHLLSFALYVDTSLTGSGGANIYQLTYKYKHSVEYKIRETEIAHEKETAIIRKAIAASPYPVIYCGDINSTPASYTYNALRGAGLQDAFLEKGRGIGSTFYKLLGTLRIDVCLPDKSFKVVQCTVPQLYLSDHFPVVTDLRWR